MFMYENAAVSWCSKKEVAVTLLSVEAEHIATSRDACQAKWLSILMQEMKG